MHRPTLFLSPEGDPAPPATKPRVSPADRYISRYGTADAAVTVLIQDLDAAERTAAAHAQALEDMKKQLPGADKVLLPKTDADELASYRALNLAPDKLTAALTERDTLKTSVARADSEKQYRAVAKAAGLDEDAFVAYALRETLPTELRDVAVTEHGKTVTKKLAYVRDPKDDKAPFVALSEYLPKLPAHEQRALQAAPQTPAGVLYPEQQPTPAKTGPVDRVAEAIAKQHERAANRPNPLFPARKPAGAAS